MDKGLTALSLMIILVSLTVPVFATGQAADSPISEGPLWTREYEEDEMVYSYPVPDGDFLIMHGEKIDLVDENGERMWTQNLSSRPMIFPTVKEGKLYMLSESEEDERYNLNCLYMDNGTKKWDMEVDHRGFHIAVNDEGEIFLPHIWKGNITKISPDQEILWEKDFTDDGHIINMFMIDGKLYLTSGYDENKALCISSDGEVEWEFTKEDEGVGGLRLDKDGEILLAYTERDIYEVDKDGNGDKIYQIENGTSLNSVMYNDGRYYFSSQENEGNGTYLKAVSEDGKMLWNNTLESTEDEYDYLQTYLTLNDRIYCEYRNGSKNLKTDKIKVYDLNGEIAWEHEYGNDTQRQYHYVNEDGVIVTWDRSGEVLAYQGKAVEKKSEDGGGGLSHLSTGLIIGVIMTIALLYHRRDKRK